MYTPPNNRWQADPAEHVAFMQEHSFAVITCASPAGSVLASHVPVVSKITHGAVRLEFHLATVNEQAAPLKAGAEVRVIFSGPHAYISPAWYQNRRTVPTWNYLAVHAVGRARPMTTPELTAHLDELVKLHEAGRSHPGWELASVGGAGGDFVQRMAAGIVGLVLDQPTLHAKRKLNQNRSLADRTGVIAALRATGQPNDAAVAQWMERVLGQGQVELDD
jgi:transcriptional regulator